MRIVIAPDSFKGSITAIEFADIAYDEIKRLGKNIDVYKMPLSDGGEGCLDIIYQIKGGRIVNYETFNPYMEKIIVPVLYTSNMAFIESAKVIGLTDRKDPLNATSYGLGYLIKSVILEAKVINVFLGGTATNDAGMGMIDALKDTNLEGIVFNVMCDVTNPLYGENGATKVFSRQKGADDEMINILEERIISFSKGKEEFINRKGAGAAGGLGFAFMAYYQADYYSGIDYIIDLYDNVTADLIITGEGKYDSQSLNGKVISGLKKRYSNIVSFCGKKELEDDNVICINSSMDKLDTEEKLREAIRCFLVEKAL